MQKALQPGSWHVIYITETVKFARQRIRFRLLSDKQVIDRLLNIGVLMHVKAVAMKLIACSQVAGQVMCL